MTNDDKLLLVASAVETPCPQSCGKPYPECGCHTQEQKDAALAAETATYDNWYRGRKQRMRAPKGETITQMMVRLQKPPQEN